MESNDTARTAKAKRMQGSVLCQCKVCGQNGTYVPRITKQSHKKSSFLRKQQEIRTSRARMLLNSRTRPSKTLALRVSPGREEDLQGEQDIEEASGNVASITGSANVSVDRSVVPSPSLMDLDSLIYPTDYPGLQFSTPTASCSLPPFQILPPLSGTADLSVSLFSRSDKADNDNIELDANLGGPSRTSFETFSSMSPSNQITANGLRYPDPPPPADDDDGNDNNNDDADNKDNVMAVPPGTSISILDALDALLSKPTGNNGNESSLDCESSSEGRSLNVSGDASHKESTMEPPGPSTSPPLYSIDTDAKTDGSHSPRLCYDNVSNLWFVRAVMLLVTFLNSMNHLGVKSCNLILSTMKQIFVQLKLVPSFTDDCMPITLATTLDRFGIRDCFRVYPACPKCERLYDTKSPIDAKCTICNERLYPGSFINQLPSFLKQKQKLRPAPLLAMPVAPISSLLADFLSRDGIEKAVEAWSTVERRDGELKDIMDGNIWKMMTDINQKRFFSPQVDSNELRLGVTLSLDWFSCRRSVFASSHSSGVLSFCAANLPPELRYRVNNLFLSAMTPGPKEPTADQLQHLLALIVDDLLALYERGINIKTPMFPEGRLVRIALIAVVCDHPAMCKIAGFADKNHSSKPCPACAVTQARLFTEASLKGESPATTGASHREKCFQYRALKTQKERDEFFQTHGVRWSELARLPYFDMCRQVIIDPMHNILLGLVKTHWYNVWIKGQILRSDTDAGTERELHIMHEFLTKIETPPWVARLPSKLGEPAGGSLSADEYKFLLTVFGPLVVPTVWDETLTKLEQDFEKATQKYTAALAKYNDLTRKDAAKYDAAVKTANSSSNPNPVPKPKERRKPSEPAPPRMRRTEVDNFLQLSAAVRILLAPSLTTDDVAAANKHLTDYLLAFQELYPHELKPNHHFCTHIAQQILDLGPVYGFWAFLTERLNFVLKQFRINNWDGGQLEISMMRAFQRDGYLRAMFATLSQGGCGSQNDGTALTDEEVEAQIAFRMDRFSTVGSRGTVDTLVVDIRNEMERAENDREEAKGDAALRGIQLGKAVGDARLDHEVSSDLMRYYRKEFNMKIVSPLQRETTLGSMFLNNYGVFYQHLVLDGRRLVPASRARQGRTPLTRAALVKVLIDGTFYYGEVLEVFVHEQNSLGPKVFVRARWMVESNNSGVTGSCQSSDIRAHLLNELGIRRFHLDKFHETFSGLPCVVPASLIICQLARVPWEPENAWIVMCLEKVLHVCFVESRCSSHLNVTARHNHLRDSIIDQVQVAFFRFIDT